jgi:branched-chain amino acid transport system substrate-binding protein
LIPVRGSAPARTRALSLGAILALAATLAGCAAASSNSNINGGELSIWASRPPGGAGGQAATDVLDAEQLGFAKISHTVGKYTLSFHVADGSELSDNARTAIQDPNTIAYLGEIQPGASAISTPITNELGILELSPTDTAAYMTKATPAVSDSPGHFFPSSTTYKQTFARVVPTTADEAKALVAAMSAAHVSKLYISSDDTDYGRTIALEVRGAASSGGLSVVSSPSSADAIFYGAVAGPAAAKALDGLASKAPDAKLFAPSGAYDDAFVAGLSSGAQSALYVSSPGYLPSALSAGAQQFAATFKSRFGHAPAPQAIFGYEAVLALGAVLSREGSKAGSRSALVATFRSLSKRVSPVLGTYSISLGDTSIAPFVIARARGGALVPQTAENG